MAAPRKYTASDLVVLPKLTAASTLALTTKVLTTARAEKRVPKSLDAAVEAVVEARDALHDALRAPEPSGEDPEAARSADLVIDTAWGAAHDWLSGWKRNAKCTNKGVAKLYEQLFGVGLAFLTLRYAEEWSASDTRLAVLEAPAARKLVKELGGELFIVNLRAAHDAYGKVLGVTEPALPESEQPDVRAAMDAAQDALRVFVLAAAHVSTTGPRSNSALAARLLAPITEWAPPGSARKEGEEKLEPAPNPEPVGGVKK